jgi:hypothetical protein
LIDRSARPIADPHCSSPASTFSATARPVQSFQGGQKMGILALEQVFYLQRKKTKTIEYGVFVVALVRKAGPSSL